MLAPTPRHLLLDLQGRPYFLWDEDTTLEQFEKRLASAEPAARAYAIGKLMRQAKPDDVFELVTPGEIRSLWPEINRYLGQGREFWTWFFGLHSGQAAVYTSRAQKQRQIAKALCELLARPCLDAIQDLKRILGTGNDLPGAVVRAPFIDGGFSPLTLAWQLHGFPIEEEAGERGWKAEPTAEIAAFRDELVRWLTELSLPE